MTVPAENEDPHGEVRALLAAGRYRAAVRHFAANPPGDPESLKMAATASLGRRDAAAALRFSRTAALWQPADGETLKLMSKAHQAANRPLPASRWLERLTRIAPADSAALTALAGAYRRDARFAEALAVARSTLDDTRNGGGGSADLLYELAMSHAGLGAETKALAAFEALLAEDPEHAAAWFGSHALVLERDGIGEALVRLDRATRCGGAAGKYWGFLAAYLLLLGRTDEAGFIEAVHIAGNPKRRVLVDGARALLPGLAPDFKLFGVSRRLLRHVLDRASVSGLVLEFGVRRGTSLNHIAEAAGQPVHGFDSFEGLPEGWVNTAAGALTTDRRLPAVRDNARLHVGWFEDTLPGFLATHAGPVRFANIDSDIYSSARTVLTALAGRLVPGTILVFDEYIGNHSWRDDEYRAFQEQAAAQRLSYRYIAANLHSKQVAVLITAIG